MRRGRNWGEGGGMPLSVREFATKNRFKVRILKFSINFLCFSPLYETLLLILSPVTSYQGYKIYRIISIEQANVK